ncbi:MAG: chitin deacetylase [Alphaproteobacteria bacterium]|nr:chitin deacetylase [Alphaproteobacteria bacterium]
MNHVTGHRLAAVLGVVLGLLALPPARAAADGANSAVVIMYHRFGEDKYPSTNIRLEQIDAHIRELTNGKYTVWPVRKIVETLRAGERLPDRTVGISIDDGFVSVATEAWPRFRKAGLPFTLFTATDYHDQPIRGYLAWDQIREMAKDPLVDFGHHSASHAHMADGSADAARAEIDKAFKAWEEKTGRRPVLFAYPFGEAGGGIIDIVREAGFAAAFGQHSGAIGPDLFKSDTERFYLPRFAFNENWGGEKRFRQTVNAVALPIADITPDDPLVAAPNPPAVGFTLARPVGNIGNIVCHSSHQGTGKIERLGESRIEVRYDKPFPKGRTRVNCTLPAPKDMDKNGGDGRWYWFGRQFYVR